MEHVHPSFPAFYARAGACVGPKTYMTLKLDYCDIKAARYAVEHYHYSKTMPGGKTVKLGVWENDRFIGAVIFSRGATRHIGFPYALEQTQICELSRVALSEHEAPVTQIVAVALRILKRDNPGIRLVVSYASIDEGHTGAIYHAGNWLYEGVVNEGMLDGFVFHGKKVHLRRIGHYGKGAQSIKWVRANLDPKAEEHHTLGKHKFIMPLDDDMRDILNRRAGGVLEARQSTRLQGTDRNRSRRTKSQSQDGKRTTQHSEEVGYGIR